ncbi:hypothetical protein CR513_11732, partial [Mucuna pruriens]
MTNIVIEALSRVQEQVVFSLIGGHMSIAKTLRTKNNFYWQDRKYYMKQFILQCSDYQHTKYSTQKLVGLLQPILIPSSQREDLALDFVMGLLIYQGCTIFLVMVNCFSTRAHFSMLPIHFIAFKVTYGKPPPSIPHYMSLKAQNQMKICVDIHRKDVKYYVIDCAFLIKKLGKRYYDPRQILESFWLTNWDDNLTPSCMLVLVQWIDLSPKDTSWEDCDALKHSFHLENKVVFEKLEDDKVVGEEEDGLANPILNGRSKRLSKCPIGWE